MQYFIGLDNGGTMTKAALFDSLGREIGKSSMPTTVMTPKPDYVERDMEQMWEANCSVIRMVLEKTGIDPASIAGIGVCGHGKGLYLWGKDNKPAGYGILSADNRAYRYPEQWTADGTQSKAFAYTCQNVLACQPAALLAWIRDNEPERYANIRYVFECKDYVRFRLTGKAGAELSDYSGSSLLNLHTKSFDRDLLRLFGLEDLYEAMPPLCCAAEVCGTVTPEAAEKCGLKPGTPVIGGMFDINACAIAAGVTDPSVLCAIVGTWSINEYISRETVPESAGVMNSIYCLPGYYLIESSSATGAGNNEWFVQQLLCELQEQEKAENRSIYDLLDKWVEEIPPKEYVPVFLPFLMGSNVHPNAKATFVGMNVSHNRKHLARSVFEGITFSHRYHIDKLLRARSDRPSCIRLAGGAAKADVWAQMFADVLQIPVETVSASETGALGCAIAAAAAVGAYSSVEEAIQNMTNVSRRYEPDPSLAYIYEKKYNLYCKAIICLDGLWNSMQELVEGKH